MAARAPRRQTAARPAKTARSKPRRPALAEYHRKRDFDKTSEPAGGSADKPLLYVIQKHAASRLHFDFRLELGGTLKSWAVPKGPSLDPNEKRLAVHVEDHPIEYGDFEGTIPKGQYGGGTVMLWDRGHWEPTGGKDPQVAYGHGHLEFRLHGERLRGAWMLVQMKGKAAEGGKNWLLIKRSDAQARGKPEEPVDTELTSVTTGRAMDGIAKGLPAVRPKRAAAAGLGPSALPGAKRAALPSSLAPQLATLADEVPADDGWIHEIKFDGYRMLAFVRDGRVKLVSRTANDWTRKFPNVVERLSALPVKTALLDGEMIALRPDGKSSFQDLQHALHEGRTARVVYQVFDLLHLDGYDLTRLPLLERKQALATLLARNTKEGVVRYTDHVAGRGPEVYQQACRLGLEGIVSKQAAGAYANRRTRSWLKVKCTLRQEFVVVGFTDPQGARTGLGALLVGYHDENGRLTYGGKVGTGFDTRTLRDLSKRFAKLAVRESPLQAPAPKSETRGAHWVRPEMVVEVQFAEWTSDNRLRHPTFLGIREDKQPSEVRRERAARPSAEAPAQAPTRASTVRLTHPERVLWPELPFTKQQLADYYESVAGVMLPQLVDRPLAVVRCPQGRTASCFFQKNWTRTLPKSVRRVNVGAGGKGPAHMTIHDLDGLIGLVQIGALEIHPWTARGDRVERPDRIVFDLDPDSGVPWNEVVDAALALRARLATAGLTSFPRTTGGKGLHVVLPIARRASWDDVKAFTRGIAEEMVRCHPRRYVSVASKAARKGKIFLDWLRNTRGATAIASYSTRAREGAPVATPLTWEELTTIQGGDAFDVRSVPERVRKVRDPWPGFDSLEQSLPRQPGTNRRARAAS